MWQFAGTSQFIVSGSDKENEVKRALAPGDIYMVQTGESVQLQQNNKDAILVCISNQVWD